MVGKDVVVTADPPYIEAFCEKKHKNMEDHMDGRVAGKSKYGH
jgi:hypothetical protein